MYTFDNANGLFEDIIYTKKLIKIDVIFNDGLIINDILYEMKENNLFTNTNISQIFLFSSTDLLVVNVSNDDILMILDNWKHYVQTY